MTTSSLRTGTWSRFQRWIYRHPRVQLVALLALPLGALCLVYFGSLLILLANAFWTLDPFTRQVQQEPSLANFQTILTTPVYGVITMRTIGIAALVTITCAVIGFPVAYYIARIATQRRRRLLVVMILLPLWASYLVKVFAWRAILQNQGVLNWLLEPLGLEGPGYGDVATWLVFTYLWLPYIDLAHRGRSGAHPEFAAGSVGGPGRTIDLHLPQGHPALVTAGRGRWLHLHVFVDHG